MQSRSLLLIMVALAACAPTVPNSAPPGVGFEDYGTYRPAPVPGSAVPGGPLVPGGTISSEAIAGGAALTPPPNGLVAPGRTATAAELARQAEAAIANAEAGGSGSAAATATPVAPARTANNGGISDENDFSAVASRETIESDRARLAELAAGYQTIQPTALPDRPRGLGPSIVEFALSTSNQRGEPIYRRSTLFAQNRFNRNCGKFVSQDQAQTAFLEQGGPQRDPRGLDPDGDGFACYWDPAPFRLAGQGSAPGQVQTQVQTQILGQ